MGRITEGEKEGRFVLRVVPAFGRFSSVARASPILWLLQLSVAFVAAERVNKSASGGLFWSTSRKRWPTDAEVDQAALVVDNRDGIDGGFSSPNGMLQWAIGKLQCGRFAGFVSVLDL